MSVDGVYCLTRVTQLCVTEAGEDDYVISCLLMVFIAVALPRLARTDNTFYKAALEGTCTSTVAKACMYIFRL